MMLNGISQALIYVPCIPLSILKINRINPDNGKANNIDIANSILNFCIYFSDLFGPVIGGLLSTIVGFEKTSFVIMIINFAMAIYIFIKFRNIIDSAFKQKFLGKKLPQEKALLISIKQNEELLKDLPRKRFSSTMLFKIHKKNI